MKRINIAKTAAAVALSAACILPLTACAGGNTASGITATYMMSEATYLDEIAWYSNEDVMLVTRDKDTYELYYKRDVFGTTDPGMKGEKTIVYTGTYTSTASADGDATHLDLTLSAPTRIYMEQHGKAFGRDAISTNVMLDTANWTDAMTTVAFPFRQRGRRGRLPGPVWPRDDHHRGRSLPLSRRHHPFLPHREHA